MGWTKILSLESYFPKKSFDHSDWISLPNHQPAPPSQIYLLQLSLSTLPFWKYEGVNSTGMNNPLLCQETTLLVYTYPQNQCTPDAMLSINPGLRWSGPTEFAKILNLS